MRLLVATATCALLCCAEDQAFQLRQFLKMAPDPDPLAPHILQHGDGTVDIATPLGTARGLRTSRVDKWLGIPYAHPPVGARRWQESTLLDSWTPRAPNIVISDASPDPMRLDWSHHGGGPLNATTFAPSCYTLVTGGSWIRSEPESEDCLALNVYIPAGHVERMQKTGALLPVVLWLHGGGFIMGSSSNPSVSPPPDLFVSEAQVVFVSINYRQGPFGFLSSSAMPDFGGMLGIGDQTNAMRWIQRYIAYFGGDKNKVTVMGESAGAISICMHLVLKESMGLFHKAILESGICEFPYEGPAAAHETTRQLADRVGCAPDLANPETLAELRRRSKHVRRVQHPPANYVVSERAGEQAFAGAPAASSAAALTGQQQFGASWLQSLDRAMGFIRSEWSLYDTLLSWTGRGNDTLTRDATQPAVPATGRAAADAGEGALRRYLDNAGLAVNLAWQRAVSLLRAVAPLQEAVDAAVEHPGPAVADDGTPLTDQLDWWSALGLMTVEDTFHPIPETGAIRQAWTNLKTRARGWGNWAADSLLPSAAGDANATDEHGHRPDTLSARVMSHGRFAKARAALDAAGANPSAVYELPALSKLQLAADEMVLDCLRKLPAETIRRALTPRRGFFFYSGASFMPVINTMRLPDHPLRLIERGQWAKHVKILHGHNKDEATMFVLFAYPFLMTEGLVKEFLEITVGVEHATALWNHFVARADIAHQPLRTRVSSLLNAMWACSSHHFAALLAQKGGDVKFYTFNHEPSYTSSLFKWLGSFHGAELDFVFGVHQTATEPPTSDELHLTAEMMRLWAEFVTDKKKVLVPDARGGGTWMIVDASDVYAMPVLEQAMGHIHVDGIPPYTNETQYCVNLQTHPMHVKPYCRPHYCALWDVVQQDGLVRVPPQTPEPYLSIAANVWGPAAVAALSKYLWLTALALLAIGIAVAPALFRGARALLRTVGGWLRGPLLQAAFPFAQQAYAVDGHRWLGLSPLPQSRAQTQPSPPEEPHRGPRRKRASPRQPSAEVLAEQALLEHVDADLHLHHAAPPAAAAAAAEDAPASGGGVRQRRARSATRQAR